MKRVLIVPTLMLALTACGYGVLTPSARARVEAVGNPIVQRIEEFKGDKGRYPASLVEAGIESPGTELGKFRYEPYTFESRKDFRLIAGTFRENGFELYWDSNPESQGWFLEE